LIVVSTVNRKFWPNLKSSGLGAGKSFKPVFRSTSVNARAATFAHDREQKKPGMALAIPGKVFKVFM
jgi:hypothetical protein